MAWSEILYLAALGFSVGLSIGTTIVTFKEAKRKQIKSRENFTENSEQNIDGDYQDTKIKSFWSKIFEKLPSYITDAEKFYNQIVGKASGVKTGAQKLTQVLDKVKIDCLTDNVEYDEQRATNMVNQLVELTNKVNINK